MRAAFSSNTRITIFRSHQSSVQQKVKKREEEEEQRKKRKNKSRKEKSDGNTRRRDDGQDGITLYASRGTPAATVVLIAAEHYGGGGVSISEMPLDAASRSPVQLRCGGGLLLDQPPAAAAYLSAADAVFSGRSEGHRGQSQVMQWMDFARGDLHHVACAHLLGRSARTERDVARLLSSLDSVLSTRTFLVGERATLADAAVSAEVLPLLSTGGGGSGGGGARSRFPHLARWANTCTRHPTFRKVFGEVELVS